MAGWCESEQITAFCDGRWLTVVIFGAQAVKELGKLEARRLGNSWARLEALCQRLADQGRIHDQAAFRHEFEGIFAIKAHQIRAFGLFEHLANGERYFVLLASLKKNKGRLSNADITKIRDRKSAFDDWRNRYGQEIR